MSASTWKTSWLYIIFLDSCLQNLMNIASLFLALSLLTEIDASLIFLPWTFLLLCVDAWNYITSWYALMLKICLQLFLLSLVLNVWNQIFLEPMCPVNVNFRCCFIWGDFLIFFLSFVVFHASGALVMLPGKIAYYSYQLYSDCSNLFVFFIYIFRSEVTPKLYISTLILRHIYSVLYCF